MSGEVKFTPCIAARTVLCCRAISLGIALYRAELVGMVRKVTDKLITSWVDFCLLITPL